MGNSRVVRLRSGGWLEFDALVDWFSLSLRDREFLFSMSAAIDTYEQSSAFCDKERATQILVEELLAECSEAPEGTPRA